MSTPGLKRTLSDLALGPGYLLSFVPYQYYEWEAKPQVPQGGRHGTFWCDMVASRQPGSAESRHAICELGKSLAICTAMQVKTDVSGIPSCSSGMMVSPFVWGRGEIVGF